MRKWYSLCFILILCISALSGCRVANELQKTTEHLRFQDSLLSEDTSWIDTPYKLGVAITETYYETDKNGDRNEIRSGDVLRLFDFLTGIHNDHKITLGDNKWLIPYNNSPGFVLIESKEKYDVLYEIHDDLSIGRKANIKLKDREDIISLVDDMIYYYVAEDSDFFSEGFPVRKNLTTGEIVPLEADNIFAVSNTNLVISERIQYFDRIAKDGKTALTEKVQEIGILNQKNEWTGIVKAGWECDFSKVVSACWLDECRVLIAMTPSDELNSSIYIYDIRTEKLSRLVNDNGTPIYLYERFHMDRTMYPDPSGEYIAYFLTETPMYGFLHSAYVLSLKTGKVSRIAEYTETDSKTEDLRWGEYDPDTGMLIWR